jgi:hypothetical protein
VVVAIPGSVELCWLTAEPTGVAPIVRDPVVGLPVDCPSSLEMMPAPTSSGLVTSIVNDSAVVGAGVEVAGNVVVERGVSMILTTRFEPLGTRLSPTLTSCWVPRKFADAPVSWASTVPMGPTR